MRLSTARLAIWGGRQARGNRKGKFMGNANKKLRRAVHETKEYLQLNVDADADEEDAIETL
jgi:hypothetical protein